MDKDYSFVRVYQPLDISATIKSSPEDFIVEENLTVEFSGDGEHCWLYIKKRGCNTDWVAQQLAKYCNVKNMAVSYAGLKDRNAITSQWFSVQLPGKPTPDWQDFEALFTSNEQDEDVRVLQCFRHNRKLQRGALKGNAFQITLSQLSKTDDDSFERLKQRCDEITKYGVPNYFGEQRFGRNRNNLNQAEKLFLNSRNRISRHKRSLYLSTARSWLFNCILSERIKLDLWGSRLSGDVFMLDGKSACFKDEQNADSTDELEQRLAKNEIHPTAILWGEGDVMVTRQTAELESEIIRQFPVFRDGLVAARLKAQRRACRVVPANMSCLRQADNLTVSFSLPAGSYATMVLAELISAADGSAINKPA